MYICVLFSLFGCGFVFRLFVTVVFGFLFCWCHGFFTHNENIVTFRCGGGESRSCFLHKIVTKKKISFAGFLEFYTIFDWF